MDTIKPTLEELEHCMRDLNCIRNVCILAHVDHGKTTIADSLLSTNKLVSKRQAGFLRYLDDRPDEQRRGITMKSSAVSLLNLIQDEGKNNKIMLNLIDTPGHIDFLTEVSAAVRVSEGCLIVVDLVEGVCSQTRECIKIAFEEHTKMILILNKLDRLIVELRKEPYEIFQKILRCIEQCNAIIAELYQYEFPDLDIDESDVLFVPNSGNVIFASGLDGWGFTTKQIANLFKDLIKNETVDSLNEKIWNFNCYIDSTSKEVKLGAVDKKKTNLFVQLCIKTITHVYETILIRMEKDKTDVILKKLQINNITKDMLHNDVKIQTRAILQAWKPLAQTILLQCLQVIPPPSKLNDEKIEYLLNINKYIEDPFLAKCIEDIVPYFKNVSNDNAAPTVGFISKMFAVSKRSLSQFKPKPFVPKPRGEKNESEPKPQPQPTNEVTCNNEDVSFIALTRVYSGTLRVGQEIYIMSGQYLPNKNDENVTKTVIKELYMLFGRELLLVDSIPAGNFCGIGNLNVLRTATLSSTLLTVPVVERSNIEPVVRHAVEPVNPKELNLLRDGLKMLMQSDSCVEVLVQETGELTLLTAGDVHLGKCVEDLKKFTKIEFTVSKPMVSLRETILNPAEYDFTKDNSRLITLKLEEFTIELIAVSLPDSIVNLVKTYQNLLRTVEEHQHKSFIDIVKDEDENVEKTFKSEITRKNLNNFKQQLKAITKDLNECWTNLEEKIWSVSKVNNCKNLLLNNTNDYTRNIYLKINSKDKRSLFDHCIVKTFQTFCKSGPLCEEPLTDCCFVITSFNLTKEIQPEDITPQITSSIESSIKSTLKKAFEKQEQRLMEPMYVTDIQVNTNILGKVYTVINKRHGKVLEDVCMDDLEKIFLVKAQIPVIESEGFANEIRKATSGQANPSLKFSHYEVIDGDPFYVKIEDDEDEDDEINVESGLRANRLRKEVRRRKGLNVEDEVVVHAEKQRTLNKKK